MGCRRPFFLSGAILALALDPSRVIHNPRPTVPGLPKPHEYVTFYGKRDLAVVIKLRVLRWEVIPDYPGGSRVIVSTSGERLKCQSQKRRCEDGGRGAVM